VLRAIEKGACVHYLLPFLLSYPVQTVLSWSQDGSEHPRFKEDVLLRLRIPDTVLEIRESLNDLVYRAIYGIQRSRQLYAKAEHLLIEQLGLGELDLSLSLYHERSFSEAREAGRFDAEFFQEKYYRLLEAINRGPFGNNPLGIIIEPIRNGYDLRDFGEEGIPYIRVGDLKNGRINIEGANRVSVSWDKVKKDIRLKVGDVLMTRKGSYGNAAHVRAGQEDSLISSEIMLLRISDTDILPQYLSTFMNSIIGFTQVERYVHGVAFYSISQNDLASIRIIRAPRRVQNRVADLIQQGDVLFEESKWLLDEAKRMVEEAVFKGAK
jgi:type I restriction enzyme M protein